MVFPLDDNFVFRDIFLSWLILNQEIQNYSPTNEVTHTGVFLELTTNKRSNLLIQRNTIMPLI